MAIPAIIGMVMFDIGFWELAIIAAVMLVTVGPERLPAFARQLGKWFGKTRREIRHLKKMLEDSIKMEEGLNEELSQLDNLMKNAPDNDPSFVSRFEKKPQQPK